MKKRLLLCLSIVGLISTGLSVSFFHFNEDSKIVNASSYSVNTVPYTIDLNDTSASSIRNYYSSLNNLSTSERQGTNLLKNLKPILKNGQKYFSYGKSATTAVWQAYEIVDRDWDKSPASEISGYNSSTNKITNYVYGKSNSDVGSNPYIHALYINRDVDNQTRAWGNHNQDNWGINQEHIWAKSCGFDSESPSIGARGDLMHLWAGNGKVNGTHHSNYYYGYVDTTRDFIDAKDSTDKYGNDYSHLAGNLRGYSKTKGGTYLVFEPQDSDKGDIARALFYMAARYNYLSGSDSDGIDAGNPNLEIINELNWAPGTAYTSSTGNKGQMGILQDLLEWNRLDPPDEWEIHRNNLLYNNFTNNRNPFIDYPEWAEFIWGKSVDGNYSSTSTGYAKPSTDTINGYNGGSTDPVAVTGVSISPTQASVYTGETVNLTASITPSNATNQSVTWTSNNTSVATVSENGVVTGVSEGSASITVTTSDGGFTATCAVKVEEKQPDGTIITSDYTSGYAVSGTSGTILKTINTANDLSISYAGINTQSSSGNPYSYTMYVKDNGYIYSTSCPSGYYPSEVVVTFSSSTGVSGKAGINYGSSVISSIQTVSGSVSKSGTCYLTNSDSSKKYWNFSTNGANVQVSSIALTYTPVSEQVTSISATVNGDKTFAVGETITKSDITVMTNTGVDVTSLANFSDYQFTYSDAASGGALTNKILTNAVTYGDFSCSLTVQAYREAFEPVDDISDELDNSFIGVTGTSYSDWSNKEAPSSEAIYAGNSAGGNSAIQLRSNNNNSGIVTTSSGGDIHTVTVTWNINTTNGRTLNVYGKSTAYSAASDLYGEDSCGTLLGSIKCGTSTSITVTGNYPFIGIRSNSGALYLDSVTFTYYGFNDPINVSNYIMYEDTNNQCISKTDTAISYYNRLSAEDKTTFLNSSDYVISSARERFMAWLAHEGKAIGENNNVQSDKMFNVNNDLDSPLTIIVIAIASISLFTLTGFLCFLKKRK